MGIVGGLAVVDERRELTQKANKLLLNANILGSISLLRAVKVKGGFNMDADKYSEARKMLVSLGADELADIILKASERISDSIDKAEDERVAEGLAVAHNIIRAQANGVALRYALGRGYQKQGTK